MQNITTTTHAPSTKLRWLWSTIALAHQLYVRYFILMFMRRLILLISYYNSAKFCFYVSSLFKTQLILKVIKFLTVFFIATQSVILIVAYQNLGIFDVLFNNFNLLIDCLFYDNNLIFDLSADTELTASSNNNIDTSYTVHNATNDQSVPKQSSSRLASFFGYELHRAQTTYADKNWSPTLAKSAFEVSTSSLSTTGGALTSAGVVTAVVAKRPAVATVVLGCGFLAYTGAIFCSEIGKQIGTYDAGTASGVVHQAVTQNSALNNASNNISNTNSVNNLTSTPQNFYTGSTGVLHDKYSLSLLNLQLDLYNQLCLLLLRCCLLLLFMTFVFSIYYIIFSNSAKIISYLENLSVIYANSNKFVVYLINLACKLVKISTKTNKYFRLLLIVLAIFLVMLMTICIYYIKTYMPLPAFTKDAYFAES